MDTDGKCTREDCIKLLTDKGRSLRSAGEERYPQRRDFTDAEVCAIKAQLGPWPRALEAAGLKPVRDDDRPQRNLEKRIRAKRRRTEARKKTSKDEGSDG
ncbi:MAG: hypothetical protein PUA74_09690 [Clostridiales bacterium]|nr:hypothetical protein [Clostridiales bacterium]